MESGSCFSPASLSYEPSTGSLDAHRSRNSRCLLGMTRKEEITLHEISVIGGGISLHPWSCPWHRCNPYYFETVSQIWSVESMTRSE